jgi:hypothetical protein
MTLTDIISKITQYAKKVIVNDNSSTTAASITQAGTGDALSITGTTGTGASITTTTGTTLKLQQNNTNTAQGGTLEFFKSGGGDMVFDGASDGVFKFENTSTAATKAILFSGANVGINKPFPIYLLDVGGVIQAEEIFVTNLSGDSRIEIGATGNSYIDLKNPFSNDYDLRLTTNGPSSTIAASGSLSISQTTTLKLTNLPTYANNAAAITAGLVVNDVYKNGTGELRIVV